jgi:hypothetical protein
MGPFDRLRWALAGRDRRSDEAAWRRASHVLYGTFATAIAALFAFVLLVDPYKVVPFSLPLKREIMDVNQRWFYPMVARSGRYDSIVIGTSTIRLLDPNDLDRALGGRFANLAMDAATAWEQLQIGQLYLRDIGPPKTIVMGIDRWVWCSPTADRERITFRGFPVWMYDTNRWNDLLYLFNRRTAEIAGRVVRNWMRLARPRMRQDGYDVFLPPDESYDLGRARKTIWEGRPSVKEAHDPPVRLTEEERQALRLPALEWLDGFASAIAGRSRIVFASMPVHVAAQPVPGSREAALDGECLARISAIARRHGAMYVDWAVPSPITMQDEHYWDRLHYRLPWAAVIVQGLGSALADRAEPVDGTFRIRAP